MILAELSAENSLGRPFLLLRALTGKTILELYSLGENLEPLLLAVGDYLSKMHAIKFRFPGYVDSVNGPMMQPSVDEWRHSHWVSEVLESAAKKRWSIIRESLGKQIYEDMLQMFDKFREVIESEYKPPKMIHGDCHLDQFFFDKNKITGVVDMEVASSGAPIGDLVKLSIQASSKLGSLSWWKPLFQGYGSKLHFEHFKLRLLCCEDEEFKCHDWQGDYSEILIRLHKSQSWSELFSCWR